MFLSDTLGYLGFLPYLTARTQLSPAFLTGLLQPVQVFTRSLGSSLDSPRLLQAAGDPGQALRRSWREGEPGGQDVNIVVLEEQLARPAASLPPCLPSCAPPAIDSSSSALLKPR